MLLMKTTQMCLHLCCEGWMQFVPFEWLWFQDDLRQTARRGR